MKIFFLVIIKIYQLFFSPQKGVFSHLWLFSSPCLFKESCSDFAYRQIEEKGIKKGFPNIFQRICQCHSFGKNKINILN
jgi:putative component of membrane protein insertase Oxa1/YidC/SpoIIIJ protein YidD